MFGDIHKDSLAGVAQYVMPEHYEGLDGAAWDMARM
jgi:hypothetical protein